MLWSRKQLAPANWCALTDHSIDAVGDFLGLSPRCVRMIQAFSFQPRHWIFQEFRNKVSLFLRVKHCVRLSTYCSAGVKKGLFIFVCEFVHYVSARRKNAISILSAYSNTFAAFWPVSVPRTSIGVDLTLGHFKQLSREPRRIEILGQEKIAHF
jgi:hypothetical protein